MNIEDRGTEISRDPEERAVPIKSTRESGANPDAVAARNKELMQTLDVPGIRRISTFFPRGTRRTSSCVGRDNPHERRA